MPRLAPCTHCGQHLIVGSAHCPHCGGSFGVLGSPLALGPKALLLGLSLATVVACPAQTKYGDSGPDCHYYADADGDGYGDPEAEGSSWGDCEIPSGNVRNNRDCDDTDPTIYPGATEVPDDGVDSDCDTQDNH